jgi:hypothetical protein
MLLKMFLEGDWRRLPVEASAEGNGHYSRVISPAQSGKKSLDGVRGPYAKTAARFV